MTYKKIDPQQMQGNPFAMIGSEWMLVTAQQGGRVNTMTASWGGLGVLWRKNVAFVFIRPQRYTKQFVDQSERFTLSFYGEEHRKALAYLGRVSGKDEDKIATVGFEPREFDGAPAFAQARLVLVCKKLYAQDLQPGCFMPGAPCDADCYPEKDYHTMYVAEVEAVYEKE